MEVFLYLLFLSNFSFIDERVLFDRTSREEGQKKWTSKNDKIYFYGLGDDEDCEDVAREAESRRMTVKSVQICRLWSNRAYQSES